MVDVQRTCGILSDAWQLIRLASYVSVHDHPTHAHTHAPSEYSTSQQQLEPWRKHFALEQMYRSAVLDGESHRIPALAENVQQSFREIFRICVRMPPPYLREMLDVHHDDDDSDHTNGTRQHDSDHTNGTERPSSVFSLLDAVAAFSVICQDRLRAIAQGSDRDVSSLKDRLLQVSNTRDGLRAQNDDLRQLLRAENEHQNAKLQAALDRVAYISDDLQRALSEQDQSQESVSRDKALELGRLDECHRSNLVTLQDELRYVLY